jgi:hypothetical protein
MTSLVNLLNVHANKLGSFLHREIEPIEDLAHLFINGIVVIEINIVSRSVAVK